MSGTTRAATSGLTLTCDGGSATAALVATTAATVTIDGSAVATVADAVPLTGIPSFGTCRYLTSLLKVTTPCVPVTTGWDYGSAVTINGSAILPDTGECLCTAAAPTYQGTITLAAGAGPVEVPE